MSNRLPNSYEFLDIQQTLQQYLMKDPEFKDINWKGSVASRLVDLHSYNTMINAATAGFSLAESSLNSTSIRRLAGAKASGILNYIPASKRCAELVVDVVVEPVLTVPENEIYFDRSLRFVGVYNQVTLNFLPSNKYKASLVDGAYTFKDVRLLQGDRVTDSYIVKTSQNIETYEIKNQNIDINTLSVMVKEGDQLVPYTRYTHPSQLNSKSRLYYIRINPKGNYVIEFGDNVFSRMLEYAEVVVVDYIATKGEAGNGATTVYPSGMIGGSSKITVNSISDYSRGGSAEESIESIKRLAPMGFGMLGACITPSDYISAVKSLMSESVYVNSWGGEQNNPPKYGYVYIAVIGSDGLNLDDSTKDYIKSSIQPLSLGQITPIVTDAKIIKLNAFVNYTFVDSKTVLSKSQLDAKIRNGIIAYSGYSLEKFSLNFNNSDFTDYLKTIDPSIKTISSDITMSVQLSDIEVGYIYSGVTTFNVPIVKGSVLINGFKPLEDGNELNTYYLYDSNGILLMKRVNNDSLVETVFPGSYGTVNYDNGIVTVNNLNVNKLDSETLLTVKKADLDKSMEAQFNIIYKIEPIVE